MKKNVKIILGVVISVLVLSLFFIPTKPDIVSIANESEEILSTQMEIIQECFNEHSMTVVDERTLNDSTLIVQEQMTVIENNRDKFDEDSLEYKALNELSEVYACKIGGVEALRSIQGGSFMDIMMYGAIIECCNEDALKHEENYEKYMQELGFTRQEENRGK